MKNVSRKCHCIFVHIPKSAGTSINQALQIDRDNRGHRTILEIKNNTDEHIFNEYSKAAVVRNPWDRVYSLYRMRIRDGNTDFSFKNWFWYPPTRNADPYFWMNQFDMISDDSDNVLVDHVLSYENLNEDWNNLLVKLKREYIGELEFFNISSANTKVLSEYPPEKFEWWKEYDNDMIEEVRKIFYKDIEKFDYSVMGTKI